jgi:hypothetical protein
MPADPHVISFEEAPADLDLTPWTGPLDPPPASAADARIAQVTSLRRIRDERLYLGLTRTWEEFCERHLFISRRSIDRGIRRLREFGPAFFRVSEFVPIGSQEYRLIREHISAEGVRSEGELIPFDDTDDERLVMAITELLDAAGQPAGARAEPFARVAAHLELAARSLTHYERVLDRLQKLEVSAQLGRICRRALELGVRPA